MCYNLYICEQQTLAEIFSHVLDRLLSYLNVFLFRHLSIRNFKLCLFQLLSAEHQTKTLPLYPLRHGQGQGLWLLECQYLGQTTTSNFNFAVYQPQLQSTHVLLSVLVSVCLSVFLFVCLCFCVHDN